MRTKNRKVRIENKAHRISKKLIIVLVFLFGLLIFFLVKIFATKTPDINIAVAKKDGSVDVRVVSFTSNTLTVVKIPASTQVTLGMHRGELTAESIWKLVESEKLPGELLANSIMKSFHIPIDNWAHENAFSSLVSGNTDLPLTLRLKYKLFSLRAERADIDLSETSYLKKTKLVSGEEGYVIAGALPIRLASLFVYPAISEEATSVNIVNKTGYPEYHFGDLVQTLETLGGQVAPVGEEEKGEFDCVVRARREEVLTKISTVFNCKEDRAAPESFDIELIIGENFYKRF